MRCGLHCRQGYGLVLALVFTFGIVIGWLMRTTDAKQKAFTIIEQPTPPKKDGNEPSVNQPKVANVRPDRRPEYFGIVEEMKVFSYPAGRIEVGLLIRGERPPPGIQEPTSRLVKFDGQPDHLWLYVAASPLERSSGPIVVGEMLSVWNRGPIATTDPGICFPEYVASEASRIK